MDRKHFSLLTALMVGLVLSGCDSYSGPVRVINLGTHSDSSTGAMMVGEHDNLYAIAKRYRLPIREIIDLNNLEPPYRLAEGQRLKLPAPVDYRAKNGDTLETVASMFGVSESQLVAVNKIPAPYRVRPGQELRIPRPQPEQQQSRQIIAEAAPLSALEQETVIKEELHARHVTSMKQEPVVYQSVIGKYATMPEEKMPAIIVQQQPAQQALQQPVRLPLQGPSSFIWPVRGKVISGYGPKEDGLYNDGINIAVPRGTPVAAVADGIVAYVGNDLKSYGNLVLIRHGGGTMTAYAHLASIRARKGMAIRKGQVLGTVGATGAVDTSQLHFEIRHGAKTCDPRQYLGAV